jgi:hypothetical protein
MSFYFILIFSSNKKPTNNQQQQQLQNQTKKKQKPNIKSILDLLISKLTFTLIFTQTKKIKKNLRIQPTTTLYLNEFQKRY